MPNRSAGRIQTHHFFRIAMELAMLQKQTTHSFV